MAATKKRVTRWERLRPLRSELLSRQVDLEVNAEYMVDLSRDGRLPGHIRENLADVACRLREEARYLRQARRELR